MLDYCFKQTDAAMLRDRVKGRRKKIEVITCNTDLSEWLRRDSRNGRSSL